MPTLQTSAKHETHALTERADISLHNLTKHIKEHHVCSSIQSKGPAKSPKADFMRK